AWTIEVPDRFDALRSAHDVCPPATVEIARVFYTPTCSTRPVASRRTMRSSTAALREPKHRAAIQTGVADCSRPHCHDASHRAEHTPDASPRDAGLLDEAI